MMKQMIISSILLLCAAIAAHAAPGMRAGTTLSGGGTYTVPITLTGDAAAIAAIGIEVTYDPGLLEAAVVAGPAATVAGKQATVTPGAKGHLTVGVFGMNATKIMDGVVAILTLRVQPGQEQATKSLNYAFSASTPAGDDLLLEHATGTVILE